ncbi:hypothetical protein HNR42_003148 [Deinobacterium chartae]|uniref:Uncharacterized protein n=1 Tax=Deinobacterium chartae TaxID=521158 RepID=A0A841I5H7_9DEIO|nr:hypothetical protein [Deinobacterium chartae]MBB6099690.1 hypothetical protein [Deinobacterium chartae]
MTRPDSPALFAETVSLGFAHEDMAAVIRALEARTGAGTQAGTVLEEG